VRILSLFLNKFFLECTFSSYMTFTDFCCVLTE
jgi:hypothetical protein